MNGTERQNYRGNEAAMPWRAASFPAGKQGIAELLSREAASAWAACGAFEWIALGYLAASSALIAAFTENIAHPFKLLGVQALAAALILILCRMEARSATQTSLYSTAAQKFWHFWRHWYPHLFFLFCFEELGKLVHLVTPGWQDARLIAADYLLTGVQPAVWLEQFATPARNDFMQFAYLTYFTYLLVVGGILYYRRDWRGYWSVMTYSAAGYAIGYGIAILFPIESPWFSMADQFHRTFWSRTWRGVSLRACGGVHRCIVGRVAAPPLALLGDATSGDVHVRFDGVGTLSLRGRCIGGNGDGNVGLPDRRLADEDARRSRDGA